MTHFLAFCAFYGIALCFHALGHFLTNKAHKSDANAHGIAVIVATGASHPVTLDAVKEFVVHVIVYSGYVIPGH